MPRRPALLGAAAILFVSIFGLIAWQWRAGRSRPERPAEALPVQRDLVLPDQNQLRQVVVEAVGQRAVAVDRNTTGRVSFNENRLTPVLTPYAGRVLEVLANKGDTVRSGQPLVVLESAELVSAQNDLAAARSDVGKAKIALDTAGVAAERARRLHQQEALATKDLQLAEAELARAGDEYRRAQAALAAVENRLALFGKRPEEIAQLGSRVDRRVVIRAPIGGTLVDRKVGTGQYVKPDSPDPLFLISDLSTLWVLADIYESDVAGVRLGAPVEISVAAYPNRPFPARISWISPTVDPATRTVRVRCQVENNGGLLKPDMFARIRIISAAERLVPVVPSGAVISEGSEALIFVEEAPGRFRRRHVRVGNEANGYVEVLDGLRAGERIAARGGLLLNELSKAKS